METMFASRTTVIPRSFVREILKVTADPEIISFAGGLPNPKFFPTKEIADAAARELAEDGAAVLQYSTTEGYLPLREYIARRYFEKYNLQISPAEVLITNGSQQGLDLLGKVFLDQGDQVLLERPSYLGAIQAFSMFEPEFRNIPLAPDGIDPNYLQQEVRRNRVKLFYGIPNFQNPSGISYSETVRQELGAVLQETRVIMVEDDPYGELRFLGKPLPPVRYYNSQNIIKLGSFSKIISPGIRMGWIVAPPEVMEKLVTVKQGTDLHSNYLAQRIIYRFLVDNSLDAHIGRITTAYKRQRDLIVKMLRDLCPAEVEYTEPEGGMFLWLKLPKGLSAMELFNKAIEQKVAFVPGTAFYTDGGGEDTLRLNFSNSDELKIEIGINRIAAAMKSLL